MAIGWGVYDNFSTSNGVESPSPSFALTNFYTTVFNVLGFRNYDDATADRIFAHTFAGLNQTNSGATLVAATLEYNLQAAAGGSQNDSIALRFLSGASGYSSGPTANSAWWSFLGTSESGANTLSNWSPGDTAYHTLNLGNLAGTINDLEGWYPGSPYSSITTGALSPSFTINPSGSVSLISTMENEGVLDVAIQDDTNVDFLQLNVHYKGDRNTNKNDVITGFAGNDTLQGLTGDDILLGGAGNDTLDGGAGNDYLDGGGNGFGGGNWNYFLGSLGSDIFDGTSGFDYADYSNGTGLFAAPANGFVSPITFFVPQGIVQKSVDGSQDQLINVEIVVSAYTLSTNANLNDTIDVSSAPSGVLVDLRGGIGPILQYISTPLPSWPSLNYTVWGFDNVNGSNFNDVLYGSNSGNSFLNGNGGNDWLQEDDTYGVGNDILNGGSGNDTLIAAAGDDILDGGTGNDQLVGGTGNDVYFVNSSLDTVTELVNEGTADLVKSSISYTLGLNVENLTLTGITNINGTGNILDNVINGNTGNNTLNGLAGNDNINGGSGNDIIFGGSNNDILIGGLGNDILVGGSGKDTLFGGLGADIFGYNALSESLLSTFDVIKDYNYSQGDVIDAPLGVTGGLLTSSLGNFATISSVVGLGSNNANAFTVTGYAGTFVALNNTIAGFQAGGDGIIFLEGYNISVANPVWVV
jgi:Ca2+-binding RTX toxin-like protein